MKKKTMNLLEKSDDEILEIASPLWDDLIKNSNNETLFKSDNLKKLIEKITFKKLKLVN